MERVPRSVTGADLAECGRVRPGGDVVDTRGGAANIVPGAWRCGDVDARCSGWSPEINRSIRLAVQSQTGMLPLNPEGHRGRCQRYPRCSTRPSERYEAPRAGNEGEGHDGERPPGEVRWHIFHAENLASSTEITKNIYKNRFELTI